MKIGYWKPTPKYMRIIGDSLLIIAAGLQANSFMAGREIWADIATISLIVGKILTNVFAIRGSEQTNE
jgi:hypothetical protein